MGNIKMCELIIKTLKRFCRFLIKSGKKYLYLKQMNLKFKAKTLIEKCKKIRNTFEHVIKKTGNYSSFVFSK